MAIDPKFPFYLSNSMLRDWEEMCQKEFFQRWFKQNPAYELDSVPITLGNLFEQNVIGVSVGGKVTVPTKEFIKSNQSSYDRMLNQAELCKTFLKLLGGKKIGVQTYLHAVVIDSAGQEIPICGNLDILYGWPAENLRRAIIDLKFTADTDSTFGDFAWGRPDTMDMSQAFQYVLLHRLVYPELPDPEFKYWIYDHKPSMKRSHLNIIISEQTMSDHIERLSKAYNAISDALLFNSWRPKQEYSFCSVCKYKCEYEKLLPDEISIYK